MEHTSHQWSGNKYWKAETVFLPQPEPKLFPGTKSVSIFTPIQELEAKMNNRHGGNSHK